MKRWQWNSFGQNVHGMELSRMNLIKVINEIMFNSFIIYLIVYSFIMYIAVKWKSKSTGSGSQVNKSNELNGN